MDRGLYRVQKYDSNGEHLFSLNFAPGDGPGEMRFPRLLAVDSVDNIYISDDRKRKITIFTGDGKFLDDFIINIRASQMVMGIEQNIYVTGFLFSYQGPIIHVYSRDGKLLNRFCQRRQDGESWFELTGGSGELTTDMHGNIYYSFEYPYDIRKYSSRGKLLIRFGRKVSYYKPPELDQEKRRVSMSSGSSALGILPDGKIVHINYGKNGEILTFFLDLFNADGEYLVTLPLSKYGINFVRNFTIDNWGDFYFDYLEPDPHIVKYSLIIGDTK